MSKIPKTRKHHLYQPYPNDIEEFSLGFDKDDPLFGSVGMNVMRNEWEDWNANDFDADLTLANDVLDEISPAPNEPTDPLTSPITPSSSKTPYQASPVTAVPMQMPTMAFAPTAAPGNFMYPQMEYQMTMQSASQARNSKAISTPEKEVKDEVKGESSTATPQVHAPQMPMMAMGNPMNTNMMNQFQFGMAPQMMMQPQMMMMVPQGMMMYPNGNMGMAVGMTPMAMQGQVPQPMGFFQPPQMAEMTVTPRNGNARAIAKKPGAEEKSETLQKILLEEEQKRTKKLERNRDSARDSRKRRVDYTLCIEAQIQATNKALATLSNHQWGNFVAPIETTITLEHQIYGKYYEHLGPQDPMNVDVMMHIALGRVKHAVGLTHDLRMKYLRSHYGSIGASIVVLRRMLVQIHILMLVASDQRQIASQTTSAAIYELEQLLNLTTGQRLAITELQEEAVKISRKMAILIKLAKIQRVAGSEFGTVMPALDRIMGQLLTPEQFMKVFQFTQTHHERFKSWEIGS